MSKLSEMSRARKIGYSVAGVYVLGIVIFAVAFGVSRISNSTFKPQSEFKLDTWAHLFGPVDINKGVLYVVLAGIITVALVLWVARRMQMRPNRVQTAVEWLYSMSLKMAHDNMDERMARKWFPLIFTLFAFLLVSNLIGYIPLPVNSGESFTIAGVHIPSFQIYAATANLSLPLILSLAVFIFYNYEGVRAHGFFGYLKSLIPPGVEGKMLIFIFPLEILSNFLRLLSLTIRLWANLLAGHLLIQFMSGGLAVLLGMEVLGWFTLPAGVAIYLFEAVLIAGLQAFIFAILTAIYLGDAVEGH